MNRIGCERALAACLCLTIGAGSAFAQAKSTKDRLVGAWTLETIENILPDGSKSDPMEGKGTGVIDFTPDGLFSMMILRSDTPTYASKNRLFGTPSEYKGTAVGTLAYFGNYTVDESKKMLTMHVVQSSFGNFRGGNQKRSIVFRGDELRLANPNVGAGGTTTVVWKRGS